MYIYFGKNIPSYTKGRIYLSQFVTAEATQVPGIDPTPEDTSKETIYYGYIPQEQATTLSSAADITLAMIQSAQSAGSVWMVEGSSLANSLTVPRYAWMFIAVPADSALIGKKDDGFGGKVAFEGSNGEVGTAVNTFKFYGEFTLISAEQKLYVTEGE
ncbi:MAG: hypothetical protein J6T08_02290 [Lentisphaeria bacterium]|nr:hypothetical protein [Lentisphaeria bacterium]